MLVTKPSSVPLATSCRGFPQEALAPCNSAVKTANRNTCNQQAERRTWDSMSKSSSISPPAGRLVLSRMMFSTPSSSSPSIEPSTSASCTDSIQGEKYKIKSNWAWNQQILQLLALYCVQHLCQLHTKDEARVQKTRMRSLASAHTSYGALQPCALLQDLRRLWAIHIEGFGVQTAGSILSPDPRPFSQ